VSGSDPAFTLNAWRDENAFVLLETGRRNKSDLDAVLMPFQRVLAGLSGRARSTGRHFF
jgi:hypothetical protein